MRTKRTRCISALPASSTQSSNRTGNPSNTPIVRTDTTNPVVTRRTLTPTQTPTTRKPTTLA